MRTNEPLPTSTHSVPDEDARDTFDHVEDLIVVVMMVRARTGVVRLHPPLGDGIALVRLVAVRFEHGAHEAHLVGSTLLGCENDDAGGASGIVRHVISSLELVLPILSS